jgi:hypothetical protein
VYHRQSVKNFSRADKASIQRSRKKHKRIMEVVARMVNSWGERVGGSRKPPSQTGPLYVETMYRTTIASR